MSDQSPAILVAVGHESAEAALVFAAAEALLVGAPVRLAHVVRFPAVEPYAELYDEVLSEADATLAAAADRVRHLGAGALNVTVERIDRGATVADLADRAEESRMIVLQHRNLSTVRRFLTGSTVKGVAARAGVPVVSVPGSWKPVPRPPHVTVAVQDTHEAAVVLHAAFAEAALRGARLTMLHATWLDNGFDMPVLRDPVDRERAAQQIRDEFTPALASGSLEFPDVEVDVQVSFARPAEALVDAAAGSDLLVLGRRHHLLPLGSHLGPIARTVLDHASCPVMLAPEEQTDHASPPSRRAGLTH
ncbi:MAG: universal stress protein [Nocardioides sp.]